MSDEFRREKKCNHNHALGTIVVCLVDDSV